MIWAGLAAIMAAAVQVAPAERPSSGQGVLLRTETETVLIVLDLDNGRAPGCALLKEVLDGRASTIAPMGQGVQAVRAADGSVLGRFVEAEADASQTPPLRVGYLIDPSEIDTARGLSDRPEVRLTGEVSLMGPNPDQCGW